MEDGIWPCEVLSVGYEMCVCSLEFEPRIYHRVCRGKDVSIRQEIAIKNKLVLHFRDSGSTAQRITTY